MIVKRFDLLNGFILILIITYCLLFIKIIAEIELFYMLPYQRHKKEWFPDWM